MSRIIIDTHAHIFPKKIAPKAVENIGAFYDLPMHGDGDINTLLQFGKMAGVTHFIVNSSATTHHQVEGINNFIVSQIEGRDNVYGLCTMHPSLSNDEIDNVVRFAEEHNLIGVKLHPDFQKFDIDDKSAYRIYEKCEGKLPILFHTGDSRYEYSSPLKMIKVAKDFPDLKCVGAHFGGYDRWQDVEGYIDTPNVYFDTSSTMFKLPIEDAKRLIKLLGADRFMFGVDFPMWSHFYEIDNMAKLQLTDRELDMIYSENAIRFYGLKIK